MCIYVCIYILMHVFLYIHSNTRMWVYECVRVCIHACCNMFLSTYLSPWCLLNPWLSRDILAYVEARIIEVLYVNTSEYVRTFARIEKAS